MIFKKIDKEKKSILTLYSLMVNLGKDSYTQSNYKLLKTKQNILTYTKTQVRTFLSQLKCYIPILRNGSKLKYYIPILLPGSKLKY